VFEGFALDHVDLGEVVLRVRHGGEGSPVVLLHGHPRTHTTWHRVAPLLAERHRVICPDLRGYGGSSKPEPGIDAAEYSKRAMAADVVALLRLLGEERFAVAGHDRGSYVAFRAAMDHPEAVKRLVVMDGVPILEALERCDARFAARWWHWFFLAQRATPPERVISADPETWYEAWGANGPDRLGEGNHADFLAAIRDPLTVRAMVADYRAGVRVDSEHDRADREGGRRITCPTLLLWSARDDLGDLYADPVDVWRPWAPDVRGRSLPCGHHMAEEVPEQVAAALAAFLA
jgi:haloacetate dehalogenase